VLDIAPNELGEVVERLFAGTEGQTGSANKGAEQYSFHDRSLFVVVNERARPQTGPALCHAHPVPMLHITVLAGFSEIFGGAMVE
jgi:hypothetical protein